MNNVWGSHFSQDEVEWTPREAVHERILRHILIGKINLMRADFEPTDPSETDFDSVVIATWLRLIKMSVR
jgi:hypothetical protein